ncbi:hypothetical protein [Parashewanella tropica]|uniref:hypothetical protein n=1 Tax=Parashewanella tropica TaxID=2547970 RepID=UPI0010594FA6|nr:hypothetical protein [Parashewanella tropica]
MSDSNDESIYSTGKMYVEINARNVIKTFLPQRDSIKRFKLELHALKQFTDMDRVPHLINANMDKMKLEMTKLPGKNPSFLSQSHLQQLQGIVSDLFAHGIARHALPIRDLLVDDKGKLYMVDFERITVRKFKLSPIWLIAKAVTQSHVLRLIWQFQPHMLTTTQKFEVFSIIGIRRIFHSLKSVINKVKKGIIYRK